MNKSSITPFERQKDGQDVSGSGKLFERKPYHERFYTLFGFEETPPMIDLGSACDYLDYLGFGDNELWKAREGKRIAQLISQTYVPNRAGSRYCDFCGVEILGVEYETLADGRDRCMSCARTAVKNVDEFRKIFEDVKRNMESFFGIQINVGIRVEMIDSRKLQKKVGEDFKPTPQKDPRTIGVAIKDRNGYSLCIENGCPRMSAMLTVAHELTHIWQYVNWDSKQIKKKYGRKMKLEIYEGMAKWVEIQYAYLINEAAVAMREQIITAFRNDEYGRGFLRYLAQYKFSTGTVITGPTPFENPEEPLSPEYCGDVSVRLPPTGFSYVPEDDDDDKPYIPIKKRNTEDGPKDRTPSACRKYCYELLDEEEKKLYAELADAVDKMENEVNVQSYGFDYERVDKVAKYMLKDNPGFFWVIPFTTKYYDTNTRICEKVEFQLCMDSDERNRRQKQIDASISSFLTEVTDKMSDYEVLNRVYHNIISLIDYDTVTLDSGYDEKRDANEPDDIRSIYGVFVNKKAVCAGYARALQYLLNRFGIECAYVVSTTHAWNLVKMEGDYYYVDVTWDDHSNTKKSADWKDYISFNYFCITEKELLRIEAHEPTDDIPLPKCTAVKCNYHHRNGLYFERFDIDLLRKTVCDLIDNGVYFISFKCSDKEVYNEFTSQLIDKGLFRDLLQYSNIRGKNRVSLSFSHVNYEELNIIDFITVKVG